MVMVEKTSSKVTTQSGNNEDPNPTKSFSRFLFKALILAVLCALLPVFLSQKPELTNQTRLLLHLVLVGIAISYSLFSRRNYDEGGGDGSSNNDYSNADHHHNNLNSYVPNILEVSSVFNVSHESESEPLDDSSGDHRKFQTRRNKPHMKIPEIVHSEDRETRFVDRVSSGIREKLLSLPVRSLNYSRVSDSGRWEKVRSKRQLVKTLADDKSDVLPSPVPWRSRSSSSSPSKEIESHPSIKNLTTVESQPLNKNLTPSSSFSSPRKSTPLPNRASESPSPPPSPPPLPAFYNSASRKDPGTYRIEPRKPSVHKKKFEGGEFHPPPPPPPAKIKLDDRSAKRISPKKMWWSEPIVESKEQDTEKNDRRGFLGSKAIEESKDEEHKRRENEIHDDNDGKKIEEEEGVSGSGSDVNKKADEFIAKFREQIRLQRIESIKRSSKKFSANSPR